MTEADGPRERATVLRKALAVAACLVCLLMVVGCGGGRYERSTPTPTAPAPTVPAAGSFTFSKVASGLTRPTFVTNASDKSNRLFVLEKPGQIRLVKAGLLVGQPFLDISTLIGSKGNEQGLLGLAFHPDFANNGRFFVAYTAEDATNTVAEYHANPGSDVADPTGKVLIAVPDQYPNHNGGMLAFGPDGYLYISMGDGGSGGDPNGNGQNLNSLLGKLLRIDVDGGSPYAIPSDNPYQGQGQKHEIWAYGLRNAWRFSFDRATGDLWIGDVGQDKYEEVDFQAAGSKGGLDYGWNIMEGLHCYKPQTGCDESGLVQPVFEYDHGEGCSVIGGYVYRGKAIPPLQGLYLFADYCSTTFWSLQRADDGSVKAAQVGEVPEGINAFGEDESGEMYFVTDQDGTVYKLAKK